MAVAFANHDRTRGLSGGVDAWDNELAGQILSADYFQTASSLITISGVARGGGAQTGAFIKRGSGTGFSTGGASQSGSSSKRTASAAVNSAAGGVSSISFRRVPSSATAATGSQSAAQTLKRVSYASTLSGAGFLIGLGAKVTGATALSGKIAGADFVIATGVRRVLSTSVVSSASASQQTSAKRAATAGLSQGASRIIAQGNKRGTGFAQSATAGRQSSLSSRFSNVAASIRGAASTATQSIKRVGGSGKVAGGSSILISFTPPPLPDVVNIAGRWLVSVGITGVVPGDVVVAGQREDIELNATLDDSADITGRDSSPVLIKGTRKQA